MKKTYSILGILLASILIISCNSDDDSGTPAQECDCHFIWYENGQLQSFTQESDSTDCSLNGVKDYFGYEPNETFYRQLVCEETTED